MRSVRGGILAALLTVVAVLCCGTARGEDDEMTDTRTFTGTVSLDAPAQGPAGAVLTVTLEDVSRADAPAVQLAQASITLDGQAAPIPFAMSYPVASVDPRGVFSARARVDLDGRLLFITTAGNPVDPLTPAPADLVMTRVQPAEAPPVPDVALTDTYWKVVEAGGQPVAVAEQLREPSLVLNGQDGRLSGSGGVNRLIGGYSLDGGTLDSGGLSFSQVGMTMMAGPPEAMQQEQVIVAALGQVRGYRISGDQLTLLDETGAPVLKAVAVALN